MADEDLTPEAAAKKAKEEALKAADNPPQPYPTQEQADKIQAGEPIEDEDDEAAPKRKAAEVKPEARAVQADKPAGGYQTR